jgi:hypothetical protein
MVSKNPPASDDTPSVLRNVVTNTNGPAVTEHPIDGAPPVPAASGGTAAKSPDVVHNMAAPAIVSPGPQPMPGNDAAQPAPQVTPQPQPSASDVVSNQPQPQPAPTFMPAPQTTPGPFPSTAPSPTTPPVTPVGVTPPAGTVTPANGQATPVPVPQPLPPQQQKELETKAKTMVKELGQETAAMKAMRAQDEKAGQKPSDKKGGKKRTAVKALVALLVVGLMGAGGYAGIRLIGLPGSQDERGQAGMIGGNACVSPKGLTVVSVAEPGSPGDLGYKPANADPNNSAFYYDVAAGEAVNFQVKLGNTTSQPVTDEYHFTAQKVIESPAGTPVNDRTPIGEVQLNSNHHDPGDVQTNIYNSGNSSFTIPANQEQYIQASWTPNMDQCGLYQIDIGVMDFGPISGTTCPGDYVAASAFIRVTNCVEQAACLGTTGALADNTVVQASTPPLNFSVQSSGSDIYNVEVCFHGNFEGPGWDKGWKCLRDSTPGDGVFNSADAAPPPSSQNPPGSDFAISGGVFTFANLKTALTSDPNPHDGELIDERGIIWGVNVFQSSGICFSGGNYSTGGTCEVADSCTGVLGLTPPPPTATPSPTPPTSEALVCTDLTSNNDSPGLGDTVIYACTGTPEKDVVSADFQYSVDNGSTWVSLPNLPANQLQASLMVTEATKYKVRCRVCDAQNACTAWQGATISTSGTN